MWMDEMIRVAIGAGITALVGAVAFLARKVADAALVARREERATQETAARLDLAKKFSDAGDDHNASYFRAVAALQVHAVQVNDAHPSRELSVRSWGPVLIVMLFLPILPTAAVLPTLDETPTNAWIILGVAVPLAVIEVFAMVVTQWKVRKHARQRVNAFTKLRADNPVTRPASVPESLWQETYQRLQQTEQQHDVRALDSAQAGSAGLTTLGWFIILVLGTMAGISVLSADVLLIMVIAGLFALLVIPWATTAIASKVIERKIKRLDAVEQIDLHRKEPAGTSDPSSPDREEEK